MTRSGSRFPELGGQVPRMRKSGSRMRRSDSQDEEIRFLG